MIVKLIQSFNNDKVTDSEGYNDDPISLLVEPHGGTLIHREGTFDEIQDLRQVEVDIMEIMDCEQIAYGTFSPLTGFMDRETLEGVLNENCLPSGISWTMPLVLQLSQTKVVKITVGDRVVLTNQEGKPHAVLDVTEIFMANFGVRNG